MTMEIENNYYDRRPETMREVEPRPSSHLDVIGELSARLSALEKSNADLRSRLDTAQKGGTVEPYDGFMAHVAHVMQKHFYHDKPDNSEG